MSIAAVEDHMVNTTKQLFGNTLHNVAVLPNALNVGLLKKILPSAPAVYFAFLGGRSGVADTEGATINGRFDAYVITRHVGNDQARRRGDATTIGAYDVIQNLIPALHDSVVTDVGRLVLKNVQNLFSIQLEETFKAALYSVTFEVPNMPFPFEADLALLDDFQTFDAQYDIPDFETSDEHQKWLQDPPDHSTSQPDAEDTVTGLDQ